MLRQRAALAVCLATLIGACAGLPPKPSPPVLPSRAPLIELPNATSSPWPQREWWRAFGDSTLDTLIAQALAQSPDLAAASARLAAARALTDGTAAGSRAQVAVNASATENRLSDHGLFPPQLLGFNWYSEFDAGVNASYSFDWWGRHRAEIAAAVDMQRAAGAEREAAALTIASAVAATYYGWRTDMARRDLALLDSAAAEQRVQIVSARVAAHIERSDATHSAELVALIARDHFTEVTTAIQLQVVALAALLACAPDQLPVLSAGALPSRRAELPANATIDLIARRPEIAASRWRVEGAARNVDIARSSFLPDFSLKAVLALSSRELSQLAEAGSAAPALGVAMHLPLFDGGALRAGYARSQANLDEAVALYRAAIINAARDVNAQLTLRERWEHQAQLRDEELVAATLQRAASQQRANAGLSDQRPALDATQQWLTLRAAQIQTQYARLCVELALIRALGGGYQMETDQ